MYDFNVEDNEVDLSHLKNSKNTCVKLPSSMTNLLKKNYIYFHSGCRWLKIHTYRC